MNYEGFKYINIMHHQPVKLLELELEKWKESLINEVDFWKEWGNKKNELRAKELCESMIQSYTEAINILKSENKIS